MTTVTFTIGANSDMTIVARILTLIDELNQPVAQIVPSSTITPEMVDGNGSESPVESPKPVKIRKERAPLTEAEKNVVRVRLLEGKLRAAKSRNDNESVEAIRAKLASIQGEPAPKRPAGSPKASHGKPALVPGRDDAKIKAAIKKAQEKAQAKAAPVKK